MPLGWFRVEQFRCLREAELTLGSRVNLFVGPNASGKTSLLEAAFFLGRGRSFRSRRREILIQDGEAEFRLAGESTGGLSPTVLGIRAGRGRTELRVGGAAARGIAEMAEHFPVQVIDPDIHKLVEEGPGRRRRFLDWGVFHVEPEFLGTWQRYHLALRQRNAGLKQGLDQRAVSAWDPELADAGQKLADMRERYLRRVEAPLQRIGQALLGSEVRLVHAPGWDRGRPLSEQLAAGMAVDRRYRATQSGPHRGDIVLRLGDRAARGLVSRGQQKLLAAALLLAQLLVQEEERPGRSALLLDDPAAELDAASLERLMDIIRGLAVQLWVTSLNPCVPGLPVPDRVFHVEQGRVVPD